MYKKKYFIMLIPLISVLLASCNSNNDNSQDTTQEEVSSIDTTVDNAPAPVAPKIKSAPRTSITVEENSTIEKFKNTDKDTKDKWFYKELDNVGITYSRVRKDYMRDKTCQLLEENNSIQYVINNLTEFDLNEEQYAKLIGTSMITQCDDLYATIKESDINTMDDSPISE